MDTRTAHHLFALRNHHQRTITAATHLKAGMQTCHPRHQWVSNLTDARHCRLSSFLVHLKEGRRTEGTRYNLHQAVQACQPDHRLQQPAMEVRKSCQVWVCRLVRLRALLRVCHRLGSSRLGHLLGLGHRAVCRMGLRRHRRDNELRIKCSRA